jgi:hypothetical protein
MDASSADSDRRVIVEFWKLYYETCWELGELDVFFCQLAASLALPEGTVWLCYGPEHEQVAPPAAPPAAPPSAPPASAPTPPVIDVPHHPTFTTWVSHWCQ